MYRPFVFAFAQKQELKQKNKANSPILIGVNKVYLKTLNDG